MSAPRGFAGECGLRSLESGFSVGGCVEDQLAGYRSRAFLRGPDSNSLYGGKRLPCDETYPLTSQLRRPFLETRPHRPHDDSHR